MRRLFTGHAGNNPGQGPFMNVTLDVNEDVIEDASYDTYQCPGCAACGRAICELVKGKTLEQGDDIDHPRLVEKVGPLPQHRRICYGLALLALADALAQVRTQRQA